MSKTLLNSINEQVGNAIPPTKHYLVVIRYLPNTAEHYDHLSPIYVVKVVLKEIFKQIEHKDIVVVLSLNSYRVPYSSGELHASFNYPKVTVSTRIIALVDYSLKAINLDVQVFLDRSSIH